MEPKSGKKRARSENWLEEDKSLLKELVKERVKEIENKNTDTNTNHKKVSAWADLAVSFNSMCKGGSRTVTQLKNQWSVTKMQRKKTMALERKNTIKTGGGPPPDRPPLDSEDIASWLPEEFTVDSNEFDSDKILVKKFKPGTSTENRDIFDSVEILNIEDEDGDNSYAQSDSAKMSHEKKSDNDAENITLVIEDKENNEKNKVQPKLIKAKKTKASPKNQKKLQKSNTDASRIAENEVECRRELHELQMTNERKKSRNLDLEARELHELHMTNEKKKARNLDLEALLLEKQIQYYEKQMNN